LDLNLVVQYEVSVLTGHLTLRVVDAEEAVDAFDLLPEVLQVGTDHVVVQLLTASVFQNVQTVSEGVF